VKGVSPNPAGQILGTVFVSLKKLFQAFLYGEKGIRFIMRSGIIAMTAMLLLLASLACGGAKPDGGANGAADSNAGQQTYLNNCAACHGELGEGQPDWQFQDSEGRYPAPPHDSNGHTWHHADGLLFRLVKFGGASLNIPNIKSGMPAFQGTLDDEEIKAVLIYLKTFWTAEGREFQAANSVGDPFP
jgi:mono/diheme cytochrome c family protein